MQLSYSRTWDDMVALFRSNSELLLAIAGVFLFLPSVIAQLVIPVAQITGEGVEAIEQYIAYYEAHMPTRLLLSIPVALGEAAIFALLLDPARPTVGTAIKRALVLLLSFVLLNALVNLSVAAGTILLIVPGIYLFGRTFAAKAALVAENQLNPVKAFARGLQVTRNNGWRICGILIIILAVGLILTSAISSVIGVAISLLASPDAALVASGFVRAILETAMMIALVLLAASIYRQLAAI